MTIPVRVGVTTGLAAVWMTDGVAAGVADGAAIGVAEGLACRITLSVAVAGGIVAAGAGAGVLGAHALAKRRTVIRQAPRIALEKEPGGFTAFIEGFL
jgi:hypothetical protein